jgi:hypothetical protein
MLLKSKGVVLVGYTMKHAASQREKEEKLCVCVVTIFVCKSTAGPFKNTKQLALYSFCRKSVNKNLHVDVYLAE